MRFITAARKNFSYHELAIDQQGHPSAPYPLIEILGIGGEKRNAFMRFVTNRGLDLYQKIILVSTSTG